MISGTTLFIIQALRYFAYIGDAVLVAGSAMPLIDSLKENIKHGVGVVGL